MSAPPREFSESLRDELLALARADRELEARLAQDGRLQEGYAPELELLHRGNASVLKRVIAEHGWPTPDLVGDDACEAAWLVAQHSISDPAFMKSCVPLVEAAWRAGLVPGKHFASLVDGIRFFSRRPQVYGTYSDWEQSGSGPPVMTLWPVESPRHADDTLDARRATVGLPPFEPVQSGSARPPSDLAMRDREMIQWLKVRGWIR